MNRDEMIRYIVTWYGNWERLHKLIVLERANKIGKWFVSFEGHEPGDMHLCSNDPRGDNEGETITCRDCFEL